MREIKFRGKCILNKIWIYGSLEISSLSHKKSYYISGKSHGIHQKREVKGATVGQYIGCLYQDRTPLYEGDVLKNKDGKNFLIEFDEGIAAFNLKGYFDADARYPRFAFSGNNSFELVGNVHDNPKLLK